MKGFRMTAAAAALAVGATIGVAAQTPAQRQSAPVMFSLIGCVERIAPAAVPATTTPATPQPPMFKLTDVQPGVVGQKPITLGKEYQLTGSAEIDFAKHQNQWIEVTGSLAPPAPPVVASTGRSGSQGQRPEPVLPVFAATAVKVVNTECKG